MKLLRVTFFAVAVGLCGGCVEECPATPFAALSEYCEAPSNAAAFNGLGDIPGGARCELRRGRRSAVLCSEQTGLVALFEGLGEARAIGDDARVIGARPLTDVGTFFAAHAGIELGGSVLARACAASSDGRAVAGEGYNSQGAPEGWIAVLPPGAS